MNINGSILLFLSFVYLVFGLLVFFKGHGKEVSKIFFIFCCSLFFWTFFFSLAYLSKNNESVLFFTRLLLIPALFLPISLMTLVKNFPRFEGWYNKRIFYLHLVLIAVLGSNSFSENMIPVAYLENDQLIFKMGVWYIALEVYLFGTLLYCVWKLIYKKIKKQSLYDVNENIQLNYTIVGVTASVILPLVFTFLLPLLGYSNFNAFAPMSLAILISFWGVAILKYKLLDIKVLLSTGVAYCVSFSLCLLLFLISNKIQSQLSNLLNIQSQTLIHAYYIILGGFFAKLFFSLSKYLSRIPEKFLYKDRINVSEASKEFVKAIENANNYKELKNKIHEFFTYLLKFENVNVVYKKDNEAFIKVLDEIPDNSVIHFISHTNPEIRDSLLGYRARVSIPLFINNNVVGTILLGNYKNTKDFNLNDQLFFERVMVETSKAIEKAAMMEQFYKKVEENKVVIFKSVNESIEELGDVFYQMILETDYPIQEIKELMKIQFENRGLAKIEKNFLN